MSDQTNQISFVGSLKSLTLRFAPKSLLSVLKKAHYVRRLRSFNETDEPDLTVVKRLVRPGDTVLDVGANIGWYTKVLSLGVAPHGRVLSIEPIPPTFALLTSMVRALSLDNVSAFQVGISDADASTIMEVPELEDGGDNFYMARIVETTGTTFSKSTRYQVETRSLDSLCVDHLDSVRFVKCDVEGHEWPAIKGATEILSRARPAWMIEISGNPDDATSDAALLFARMNQFDYQCYWWRGSSLVPRRPGDRPVNYFFLRQAHCTLLQDAGLRIEE